MRAPIFQNISKGDRKLLILGGLLILVALFGWNHIIELRAEEPRRAIVSIEMFLSQNFLVPEINGWSYYNKPPVFNWWMILFFKIFGSFDEWVVRGSSLFAFLICAISNYVFIQKYLGQKVALLSSLFLISSADLLFYGTVNSGEIDLFFICITYLQVISIFWFFDKKQYVYLFIASYFFAALGTLTKGPPSIAFQALTLLPWILLHKKWKMLFSLQHALGILVFVLIVGGYFYWYSAYDDGIGYMTRLFKEAAQRTGMEQSFSQVLLGTLQFPALLFKLLAPWSLFLVFMFRKDLFTVLWKNPALKFSIIFLLFNLPLYWFSGDHKARYLYPFFPFFCILFAYFFSNTLAAHDKWKTWIFSFFQFIILLGSVTFLAAPFIAQTADLDFIIYKSAGISLTGFILLYYFRKQASYRIFYFILFLFILRIGFNFTYVPALAKESDQLIYKDHITSVIQLTNGQPVHWCGAPYTFESDASIGPLTLKKVKLTSAPPLAYQIPYYLTKGNRHIMQFDTILQKNQYYLSHEEFLQGKDIEILYSFEDNWIRKRVVLFKNN